MGKLSMKNGIVAIVLALNIASAGAVAPVEREMEGRIEQHSITIPDGATFSEGRAIWYEQAAELCNNKEFKVMRYIERTTSYGDALSLNQATGEYEAEEIPPSIFGVFLCIKNS